MKIEIKEVEKFRIIDHILDNVIIQLSELMIDVYDNWDEM